MAESFQIESSPGYVRISNATAISLGLVQGRMYRGAVNRCVNLLVHYAEGCAANCAYCGLSRARAGAYPEKSFIHVAWPVFPMEEVIAAVNDAPAYVKRSCISMITNGRCRSATIEIARMLGCDTNLPVSVLIAPTVMDRDDLIAMKDAGVDRIGVAIDLATQELFDRYRGKGVSGPHRWDRYWESMESALEIFGAHNVGAHLMVGMGETEKEMSSLINRLWQMGIESHLFSFFAEEGSRLEHRPQPPWPAYLRVQMARYLTEEGLISFSDMHFDKLDHIIDFGLDPEMLTKVIRRGTPFMTTGCKGPDGQVACNRPFGNCLPDIRQWNYPYPPNKEELDLIQRHLFDIR